MRVLPFTKYSPCGNTTILVQDASLPASERARVAAEIIAPGHLEAEQAGYVDTAAPVPRLDMMGGEFCVNATRAFAALLAGEGRLSPEKGDPEGNDLYGAVSVSGMPERLRVRVRRLAPHRFESAVLLDLPEAPPLEAVAPGIHLVRVPGIAHLVLDAAAHPTRIATRPIFFPVLGCWARMPPGASGFTAGRPACGSRLSYGCGGPGRRMPRRLAVPGRWRRPSCAGAFTATAGICR